MARFFWYACECLQLGHGAQSVMLALVCLWHGHTLLMGMLPDQCLQRLSELGRLAFNVPGDV